MKRRPDGSTGSPRRLVEGSAGYEAAPHHLDKLDAPQWGFPAREGAESPIHRALLRSTGTPALSLPKGHARAGAG
ncbi:MAG: hypothetical protein ACE5HA_18320 [Anaerolineae bacterium]